MNALINEFHKWYYDSEIWDRTHFLGLPCLKSVFDLWNYQELIFELAPRFVIETGVYRGGSALYFSTLLRAVRKDAQYVGIEKSVEKVSPRAFTEDNVIILDCLSTSVECRTRLQRIVSDHRGPILAILDSKHDVDTVLSEMELFAAMLRVGDYLVVEDTNVNGHPVLPQHGPGPMEAVLKFQSDRPGIFEHDEQRETKFGFTFCPNGYLRKVVD